MALFGWPLTWVNSISREHESFVGYESGILGNTPGCEARLFRGEALGKGGSPLPPRRQQAPRGRVVHRATRAHDRMVARTKARRAEYTRGDRWAVRGRSIAGTPTRTARPDSCPSTPQPTTRPTTHDSHKERGVRGREPDRDRGSTGAPEHCDDRALCAPFGRPGAGGGGSDRGGDRGGDELEGRCSRHADQARTRPILTQRTRLDCPTA